MNALQKVLEFVVDNQEYVVLGLIALGLLALTKLLLHWVRQSVLRYGYFVWKKQSGRWYNEGHVFDSLKIRWPFLAIRPRFIFEEDLGEETFDKEIRPLSKFEVDDQSGEPRMHQPQWEAYGNKYALTERTWKPWRYWIPQLRIAALLGLVAVVILSVIHFWPENNETVSHSDVGGPHVTIEAEVEATTAPTQTPEPDPTEEPTPEPEEEELRELVIDMREPPQGIAEQILDWMDETAPDINLPTLDTGLEIDWLEDLFRNAEYGQVLRLERGLVILVARKINNRTDITAQYTNYDLEPLGNPITVEATRLTIQGGDFQWGIALGKTWKVTKNRRGNLVINVNADAQHPLTVEAAWFRWWYAAIAALAIVASFILGRKSY